MTNEEKAAAATQALSVPSHRVADSQFGLVLTAAAEASTAQESLYLDRSATVEEIVARALDVVAEMRPEGRAIALHVTSRLPKGVEVNFHFARGFSLSAGQAGWSLDVSRNAGAADVETAVRRHMVQYADAVTVHTGAGAQGSLGQPYFSEQG